MTPRSLLPVSVTVTPPRPTSPASFTPSLLSSQYTKPEICPARISPKLLPVLLCPVPSTMLLMTSLTAVLPPRLPAVSLPSSLPTGCVVSVTV